MLLDVPRKWCFIYSKNNRHNKVAKQAAIHLNLWPRNTIIWIICPCEIFSCHASNLRFSSLRCYSKESQNLFYLGIVLREKVSVSSIQILRSKIFLSKYRQLGSDYKFDGLMLFEGLIIYMEHWYHACCVIIFHVLLLRCSNEILGVTWKEYMTFILNCEENDLQVTGYRSPFSSWKSWSVLINTKSMRTEWSRFALVILWLYSFTDC